MSNRQVQVYPLGSTSANGLINKNIFTKDFQHCNFTITASGSAVATVKVYGSLQEDIPTFTSASSSTNQYSLLQSINLDDASTVSGSTGIVYTGAGTDGTKTYEVNINLQNWIGFVVSGYSAGTITVTASIATNI